MKIALVNDTVYPYSKGGGEKRVWGIGRLLAQRGHEVHWYGMKHWDGEDVIVSEGVYLHGVCPVQELYTDGRRSIKTAIYFACKLLKPLMNERFDIIDCTNAPYFPCLAAKAASAFRRTQLVITYLEAWGDYWYEYLGKKGVFGVLIEKMTVALSNNAIAISERTKQQLLCLGAKDSSIVVVPVGVDLGEIRQTRASGQRSDIIFVGRLIREKNVHILVEAVSLLRERHPEVRAVIIGDGPEREPLQDLATALGVDDRITFLGFLERHEDVIGHMKSSRVFVLPSVREGFGIVVIEANACGLPVIVIDHKNNAACDLVVDGQTGFICSLDAHHISRKIDGILTGEHRQMATRYTEHAEDYDLPVIVDMIESVYRRSLRD